MKKILPNLVLIALATLAMSACVTTPVDEDGNPIIKEGAAEANEELPRTVDGLYPAIIVEIVSPTVIRLNRDNTKTLRFAGVTGPDKEKQPDLYNQALSTLLGHHEDAPLFYVRLRPGIAPKTTQWVGTLVRATKDGKGYFDITQGMLSNGLVRISNENEFYSDTVVDLMRAREAEAKARGLGMWAR